MFIATFLFNKQLNPKIDAPEFAELTLDEMAGSNEVMNTLLAALRGISNAPILQPAPPSWDGDRLKLDSFLIALRTYLGAAEHVLSTDVKGPND